MYFSITYSGRQMKAILAGFILLFFAVLILKPNHKQDIQPRRADSPGQESPFERLEYMRMIYGADMENLDAKQEAIKRVQKQLRQHANSDQRDGGLSDWESLGPTNEGGRVRGLAVNPDNGNQIWAGGVSGGIWKSENGGSSWSVSTPSELAYPITSITFDPLDGDIIYATTGEYRIGSPGPPGIGLLKSTNNGGSWNVIPVDATNFFWLSKVIVNPLNTDILFVCGASATVNKGNAVEAIYRSNDAGNTWQLIYTNNAPGVDHIYDIEINPEDTSILYIGTDEDVLRSSDSGNSFASMAGSAPTTPITTMAGDNPKRCEVAMCSSDPDNIYVLRYLVEDVDSDGTRDSSHSEVWYSDDDGDVWVLLSRTTSDESGDDEEVCILGTQGWYDNIAWADPEDCSRALFGGINLWKWENSTLTRISDDDDDIGGAPGGNNSIHADQHNIVAHPSYGPSNKTVFISNDGGVYKSNDIWNATANSGWLSLVPGLNITQLYDIDVSLSGDTIYGGSQDNNFFVNRNINTSGTSWVVTTSGDGGYGAIKKSDPEIIYGSTQRGRFYKSIDGGDSYCQMLNLNGTGDGSNPCGNFSNINDSALFIAPLEMDPNDDKTLYAGAKRLWRSTNDGGSPWNSLFNSGNGNRIVTIEIAKGDANEIWLGLRQGQLRRSSNGGTTWTPVTSPSMPGVAVTDIAINPNNHAEVMVVFGGGYDNDVIWYTDDSGVTWDNRSLDFNMQMYCVVWHPQDPDWVYVGTDLGVFATENDGLDWTVTASGTGHPTGNDNDGPVFTPVVDLVWQGNGTNTYPYYLLAGTHGRGIFRTTFPIRNKYYVDKNCAPCGTGSFAAPYQTFTEAVSAAGSGSEIVFLTGGSYEEVPPAILIEKRIKVTVHSSVTTPVVIE